MFKKGNFVKVKPDTKLETGEIVNDWAGKIIEVYRKEKSCLIDFDAPTLNSLSDNYLLSCIDDGSEPIHYVFEYDDLELSERRDTDGELMKAVDNLVDRMIEFEKGEENSYEKLKEKWIKEFEESSFFTELDGVQQEESNFILSTFMEFMYNYEDALPQEWTPRKVRTVCLEVVPRKITTEIETFERYGDVLIAFLKFLGNKRYILKHLTLIHAVEKIKKQIPIEANNPKNWGMAKSMMMGAQEQGVDLNNEAEIERFMMLQQMKSIKDLESNPKMGIPLGEDPYRGIGRNHKVTVKYKDGRKLENIKFKKVEADLRSGNCELIMS